MLIVGLTGGIGSGKTTVANIFSKLGVRIIDTDIIARDLVKPGMPAVKNITEHFGNQILDNKGELNRQKLAEITFANNSERKKLESILHPLIKQTMLEELKKINDPYCIVVIPLLIETSQTKLVDRVLVIDCDLTDQLARVKIRDNRSEKQITSIVDSQVSRNTRLSFADDIIENTGDLQKLHDNVEKLHNKYLKLGT